MSQHENERNRDMNDANRSTAPTPEVMANINDMIKAAVDQALASAKAERGVTAAELAAVVKELALTPEKIAELKKPYEDPAVARRKLREQLAFKEDEKETIRTQQEQKNRCSHKHKGLGLFAISFVNNFLDRQTRGVCMKCGEWFNPPEWRMGAPDAKNPKGKPYVEPRHPKWDSVMKVAAEQQDILIQEL